MRAYAPAVRACGRALRVGGRARGARSMHGCLRLLGEQHDPGTAAAARRRVAVVAGGRAEAAGA